MSDDLDQKSLEELEFTYSLLLQEQKELDLKIKLQECQHFQSMQTYNLNFNEMNRLKQEKREAVDVFRPIKRSYIAEYRQNMINNANEKDVLESCLELI